MVDLKSTSRVIPTTPGSTENLGAAKAQHQGAVRGTPISAEKSGTSAQPLATSVFETEHSLQLVSITESLTLKDPDTGSTIVGDFNRVDAALEGVHEDLNRTLIDLIPFTDNNDEVQNAHATLMELHPKNFARVLRYMSSKALSNYIEESSEITPSSLTSTQNTMLEDFATQLSKRHAKIHTDGGRTVIHNLTPKARRELFAAILNLPQGNHLNVRRNIGESAYRLLVAGPHPDSTIGKGLLRREMPASVITDEFKTAYAAVVKNGPNALPQTKNDYVYVVLPGLFGDNLPGYMEVNQRAMIDAGIDENRVSKASYNTADGTHKAALKIAKHIAEQSADNGGSDVVLLGHSMGGRHTLALLTSTRDDYSSDADYEIIIAAREKVAGNLLMQPAVNAQIAVDILREDMLTDIREDLLFIVGGTEASFGDMMSGNDAKFPGDKYPTVVLAADSNADHSLLGTTITHYYEKLYEVLSDSAVPSSDQAGLAGSHLIYLHNAGDHARPGLTFKDAAEHFAKQLRAGKSDAVLSGVSEKMRHLYPALPFDKLDEMLRDSDNRDAVIEFLEENSAKLQRSFKNDREESGHNDLDAHAATIASLGLLLGKIAEADEK